MADEKSSPELDSAPPAIIEHDGPVPRPSGWIYRGFKVGGTEIWYASPIGQLLMVSLLCFLCPGMYNALSGLGGAGLLSTGAADEANTALYSTFAVTAFFSGTIANRLGVKLTLSFGGIGYCIYAASFLCYKHTQNEGFVVFAGAFLGVCAGLLWTAQGTIMMSYPTEDRKGRYISYFWMIFNLGGVIGALIPLGQNIHNTTSSVTDGTYIAFIVLMFFGLILSLLLCDANKVIRPDGSKVILMKNPSWTTEFVGLYQTIVQQPWVVLLFPMFFASNVFYTYQQSEFIAGYFNTRTRSLLNVLYWAAQIFGAVIYGYCLDFGTSRRTIRARGCLISLFCITFAIWGGAYAWQSKQPGRSVTSEKDFKTLDWTDGSDFLGPMFLLIFFGFFDAAWQTSIYWFMGAISNSGRKAANLAGFYKGIQSAGGAIFWRLDGLQKPYMTVFGATWGLLAGSLVIVTPVIFLKIKDHVTIEEDLKFSDETIVDVVAPGTLAPDADKQLEA